jgi:hypothetical protein
MSPLLKKLLLPALFLICQVAIPQTNQTIKRSALVQKLKTTQGLVAFWDFKEKEGHARKAWGMGKFPLKELNGKFEAREPELINNTNGFDGYPNGLTQSKNPYYYPNGIGNNGSDFTVGAVLLKAGMGNFFKGQIGGLAVFKRALTDEELIRFKL